MLARVLEVFKYLSGRIYYVGVPLGMSCWFEVNFGELMCCNDLLWSYPDCLLI